MAELAEACRLSHDEVCAARELARTGLPRSLDERMNTSDEEEAVTLLDFVGSEDNCFERSLDRMALATALQTLPSREREVLRLRFYHGMSQRQTAGHVNISQMHVSRLERRALLKLRRLMQGGPADAGPPAYLPPAAYGRGFGGRGSGVGGLCQWEMPSRARSS